MLKLLLLLALVSCSLKYEKFSPLGENFFLEQKKNSHNSQRLHFSNLGKDFIGTNKSNIYSGDTSFLEKKMTNIISKNETFFKNDAPKIFIILKQETFHFSLPGYIFLSKGLMEKYVSNDELLDCILSLELIKSETSIYKKVRLFPSGDIPIKLLISLNVLDVGSKHNLNKWAYHFLKRSGDSYDSYLHWLQIQNRNYGDFKKMIKNPSAISIEESKFKSFLIDNSERSVYTTRQTSRELYRLVNKLKRLRI